MTRDEAFEAIEKELFEKMCQSSGDPLMFDWYKKRFLRIVEKRNIARNEIEENESLELYPVETQAAV